MNDKKNILHALLAFAALMLQIPMAMAEVANKPNIIIILADDLGNADLGYRGSPIRTPNIDTLAQNGLRLESYYGLPLCTPSRAALMTGRYPMRYGLQTNVIFPAHTYGLPTDEKTLPQALKEAGYATAMVGKWHLGHADKKYWPQNRGFDYFYGNLVGEVDYYSKDRGGIVDWQRNGQFLHEGEYYTHLIGNEAVELINTYDQSKPLFLYVASLAPHSPYQAPQTEIDAYNEIFKDETKRTYAAMITDLDTQVGRIVQALEKNGMRDNTLIFFTTDNGGLTSSKLHSPGNVGTKEPPATNLPFRGGKGSLYEGGVHLPAIVNWPGHIKPGLVTEQLHHVDMMPTLLALAGGTGSADHPFDGKNFIATFLNGKTSAHQEILLNVESFRGALIDGNWKLVKLATLPGKTQLFNLATDPYEKTNVADQYPEVLKRMEARLVSYAKEQKISEWLKAQPSFMNVQGVTMFDLDYDIDDSGLPHEKPVLPEN